MFALHDQTGLSETVLTLSAAALEVVALMDGQLSCGQIRSTFAGKTGLLLDVDTLGHIVDTLDKAHFLEGESFEALYNGLVDEYRAAPARPTRDAASLGVTNDSGEPFRDILSEAPGRSLIGKVRGVIAPHLDYARGRPCYAAAYGTLIDRPAPHRVVILGTNHFGRSTSVVATGKPFATPLGTISVDVEFLGNLEAKVGSLRRFEMDHAREHSVELQVLWGQHLFGPDGFTIVPFLCPDPCGPTRTAPCDGNGVDLRDFAIALGELVADDGRDTLLIAGADLSHVGMHFGDTRTLDQSFLQEVRRRDRRMLDAIETGDAEAFRACVAQDDNPTRVCSVGCIFALLTALPHASPTVLRYDQAVDHQTQRGITCAAVALITDD